MTSYQQETTIDITPQEAKSTVAYMQRKFGEVAVDVQRYKRQGEEVLLTAGRFLVKNWEGKQPE